MSRRSVDRYTERLNHLKKLKREFRYDRHEKLHTSGGHTFSARLVPRYISSRKKRPGMAAPGGGGDSALEMEYPTLCFMR